MKRISSPDSIIVSPFGIIDSWRLKIVVILVSIPGICSGISLSLCPTNGPP